MVDGFADGDTEGAIDGKILGTLLGGLLGFVDKLGSDDGHIPHVALQVWK